jgi:hypothetical protein
VEIVFPVPFVEEAIFSPMHILGSFVEIQMAVVVWVYARVFYSIGLHAYFCHSIMLFLLLCSVI